jgi:hypothetical protein
MPLTPPPLAESRVGCRRRAVFGEFVPVRVHAPLKNRLELLPIMPSAHLRFASGLSASVSSRGTINIACKGGCYALRNNFLPVLPGRPNFMSGNNVSCVALFQALADDPSVSPLLSSLQNLLDWHDCEWSAKKKQGKDNIEFLNNHRRRRWVSNSPFPEGPMSGIPSKPAAVASASWYAQPQCARVLACNFVCLSPACFDANVLA